jgi:hypothetical protein
VSTSLRQYRTVANAGEHDSTTKQSTSLPSSYLHVVVLLEELHAPLHHRGQVEVHHFVCGPVTRSQHLQGKAREISYKMVRRDGEIRVTSGLALTQCIYRNIDEQ